MGGIASSAKSAKVAGFPKGVNVLKQALMESVEQPSKSWEDMNYDEKVDNLHTQFSMITHVLTNIQKQLSDLAIHQHDAETGRPMVINARGIGEGPQDGPWKTQY